MQGFFIIILKDIPVLQHTFCIYICIFSLLIQTIKPKPKHRKRPTQTGSTKKLKSPLDYKFKKKIETCFKLSTLSGNDTATVSDEERVYLKHNVHTNTVVGRGTLQQLCYIFPSF